MPKKNIENINFGSTSRACIWLFFVYSSSKAIFVSNFLRAAFSYVKCLGCKASLLWTNSIAMNQRVPSTEAKTSHNLKWRCAENWNFWKWKKQGLEWGKYLTTIPQRGDWWLIQGSTLTVANYLVVLVFTKIME